MLNNSSFVVEKANTKHIKTLKSKQLPWLQQCKDNIKYSSSISILALKYAGGHVKNILRMKCINKMVLTMFSVELSLLQSTHPINFELFFLHVF